VSIASAAIPDGLTSFQFGNTPELADRLAALVVAGRKTASCSAAVHGPTAVVGRREIVLNSAKRPVAVVETQAYERLKFADVTPAMAALEGEGDLSHAFWADGHRAYFTREGSWSSDMDIFFEVFRLVEILDETFARNAPACVAKEISEAAARGFTALQGNAP
jgi:uncharacterized protein YhfF